MNSSLEHFLSSRKYKIALLIITSSLYGFFNKSWAQTPSSEFIIEAPLICLGENVQLSNNSLNSISYDWDFCEGDLNSIPVGVDKGSISFSSAPEGIDLVKDNANWYGFVASINNNLIVRANFGNDLNNIPSYVNLGDFGGMLLKPSGVFATNDAGNWFVFVISAESNSKLIRLNYGNSLLNTPDVEVLGNFDGTLSFNYGIESAIDEGNKFLFISNRSSRNIAKINFGSSFANTPINQDVTKIQLSAGGFHRDVAIANENNNWYGLAVSESGSISKLSFGTSLLNTPTVDIITESIPSTIYFPTDVKLLKDKGSNLAFILGRDGKLHRLDFENELSSNFPKYVDMGNIGGFTITQGFSWVKENSQWFVGSISGSLNRLYQMKFPDVCDATFASSTEFEPVNISYSTSGFKDISLTATNSFGQNDYSYDSVLINRGPTSNFSSNLNCVGTNTQFSDSSYFDKPITGYLWDFGDPISGGNNTSTDQSPLHNFATVGDYDVTLQTTDGCGIVSSRLKTIKIYSSNDIVPGFFTSTPTCEFSPISFIDQSTFVEDEIIEWLWDFDGEAISNEKDPLYQFNSAGSKSINLTVTGLSGCSFTKSSTIDVDFAPLTKFSFNNTCNTQTTTFIDETTGNSLTTWNWNFGDGNNSTSQSPIHTYATPGKYVVTLSVSNNLGCTTTKVDTVYNHDIPVVDFTNDLACSSSPVQFSDQSLVSNANLVAWEWNFGDGSTSTDQHPTHLYNQTGDFIVKLKAYSQYGCADSTQTIVSVVQGPQVDFEWDKACQGEATTFTDLTNSFGVSITNWNWIVNGTLLTNQNPTYTFTNSGTYTVQLSVTVNNLCAQTMSQDIIVEVPPVVQFDYSEGCGGSGTTFYDLTNQTGDAIIAREWRVDGSIISTDSVATIQLNPDTYAITLSMITVAGCEETTTSNVSLIGSPAAAFDVNTLYGAAPLQIDFNNLSTGGSSYFWSFGDAENTTSTEQHSVFTYNAIGVYTATLRTSSDPSCYDETTQQIEVVDAQSSAEIIAITPRTTNAITNFVITIENSGTSIIDNSSSLVFRADYGTEVVEPINTTIYAGKTINYTASYAIGDNSNTNSVCVELLDINKSKLDRSCLNINNSINISEPHPNPSTGIFSIDVMLESDIEIMVRVLNRSGQPVLTKAFNGTIGLNNLLIDAQSLPQGLYIIEASAGSKTEQFKTSIIR